MYMFLKEHTWRKYLKRFRRLAQKSTEWTVSDRYTPNRYNTIDREARHRRPVILSL